MVGAVIEYLDAEFQDIEYLEMSLNLFVYSQGIVVVTVFQTDLLE